MLGGVDRPSPRARPLAQAIDPLVMEAVDPGVDGGPGDVEFVSDSAGSLTPVDGQDDPGPLDEAGLGGAGVSQPLEGPEFLVGWRRAMWVRTMDAPHLQATSFLGPSPTVSSPAGCTS